MSNEKYLRIQTCVLKVNIHCEDCERKVKKVLHQIEGVYIIKIDINLKKVTVIGDVDPTTLIMALVKKGKRAEIWDAETSLTNMTRNLQIDNGSTGGKKKKKKNRGSASNQLKERVGGHSLQPDLTPQQKLQLKLWKKQQQQMTKSIPFKDPKLFMPMPMPLPLPMPIPMQMPPMPMPIIKNQNQMQKSHKAVRFNIPVETNENETSDDEHDNDDEDEDDDYFPQQVPFNQMNTSKPIMKSNGMFNYQQLREYGKSGQGNVYDQMNENGKDIPNQVSNNGRWDHGNFTRAQNLGNGYPPNMTHISNKPMGHRPSIMSNNNPYYQQQQLAVGMMNQQPSFGNERFHPMMYNQPPPVTNYMPHPYPQPSYPSMYALNEEDTSSCNVM